MGRKDAIISALKAGDVAAGPCHEIELEGKVERAVESRAAWSDRRRAPARRAPDHADMGADIPATPIVAVGKVRYRRLDRQVGRQRDFAKTEHHAKPDSDHRT